MARPAGVRNLTLTEQMLVKINRTLQENKQVTKEVAEATDKYGESIKEADAAVEGMAKRTQILTKTVNSLKAVNFTWKKDGVQDFGFLAQDLKKTIPQAVHGTDEGLFGVDYGRLTAVLVSAIQEQSLEISALKAQIEKK